MRSLLEQAEEMVESDELLEEEFNQVCLVLGAWFALSEARI